MVTILFPDSKRMPSIWLSKEEIMANGRTFVCDRVLDKSWLALTLTTALIIVSLTGACLAQDSAAAIGKLVGEMAGGKWTHVVRDGNLILKYRSSTGEALVEDGNSNAILRQYPAGSFSTGWTNIVDTFNGILYYNRDSGTGAVGRLDASGGHTTVRQYSNFSRGWTNVVSTPNGILFYNRNTGSGAVGRVNESGDFTTVKSYPAGGFAPGWTSIHYSSRGIEYRNDATGATAVGYIDDSGNHITR
jgi:hypothetical protein